MFEPQQLMDIEASDDLPAIERQLRINRRVGRCRIRRHKEKYWELEIRARGGRRRRFYRKGATAAYRLALQLSKEYDEHGRLAQALTSAQRYIATECYALLAKVGSGEPTELLDVVRDYMRRHPLGGNARTLDDVRIELLGRKKKLGRSERHLKGLDYKLRCLSAAIGNKAVTSVTTRELEEELEAHPDWKATTVHSTTQGWKVLFNFAIKRGYLTENPCNKLDLPPIVRDEPRILSVFDAKRLMAATLFRDRHPLLPDCRAYLSIGMFAGIRPEEMVRLDWKQVDLATNTITVTGRNAKCRARRIVDISPNLAAWLRPIARTSGPVLRHPISDLRSAARSVLGFSEWPHDVLRHTFGSYHFGYHRNEALVKNQMGHSDDGRMFFHHYRVMVPPKHAADFWSITPPVGFLTS